MRDEFSFCKQGGSLSSQGNEEAADSAWAAALWHSTLNPSRRTEGQRTPCCLLPLSPTTLGGQPQQNRGTKSVMSSRIGRRKKNTSVIELGVKKMKKKFQWLNWERKRWTDCWRGWVRTEQPEPGDKTVGSFVVGAKRFPSPLWRDVIPPRKRQRQEPSRPMSPRFTVILYIPAALLSLQDHCEWP